MDDDSTVKKVPDSVAGSHQHIVNETVFNKCTEGVIVTDQHHIIERVNPGFTRITGYEPADIIGKTPALLKSHRHDEQFYKDLNNAIDTKGVWQGEIWNRRRNGTIYPQWLRIFRVDDPVKKRFYVGMFTDSDCLTNNATLRNHAYYDSLTGLPNRMLLYDRLTFMLNLARRQNSLLGVLHLDLNRFKLINDSLGYSYGDQLLQCVAIRLKSCTREVDSVFRLGDDEFAVLLEDIVNPQDASRVAKRIISTCTQPYKITDKELYITISIGISLFPGDGEQFEVLMKNAETAMLRAKELGISNYQHYKPSMNTQVFEQLTLEYNLKKALEYDQLMVFYQPFISLADRKIVGAEALVRWQHPDLGMVTPAQFIPLAEETGLIIPIGRWVMETACRQSRLWQRQHNAAFTISVNLSARQFQQPDLAEMVNRILNDSGLAPETLKLEITESIGMKNPVQTIEALKILKAKGILIAIDDFGTGYSSLSYLKQFPIDTIKIDRSFVMEAKDVDSESAIIDAIIALAHSLNLDVIAEGVETPGQVEYLIRRGCEMVQGYYFSKPVNAEEFEALLRNPPWLNGQKQHTR